MTVSTSAVFKEWFLPPIMWWFMSPGFAFAMGLALWPINAPVAYTGGVLIDVLVIVLLAMWAPRNELTDGVLGVGPARIQTKWLGNAVELIVAKLRAALGPDLDLRTWVNVRTWMRRAVITENIDPKDPAPAWITATRRPAELLHALKNH